MYKPYRLLFFIILNIVILNIPIKAFSYVSQYRQEVMTQELNRLESQSNENNESIVYTPEIIYQDPYVEPIEEIYVSDYEAVEQIDYAPTEPVEEYYQDEETQEQYYIKAKGKRTHVDRSKNFALGNYVSVAGAGSSAIDIINFDLDDWGWGYGVCIGATNIAPFTVEANFEQSFISFEEDRSMPIVGSGPNIPIIPFIDENHGTRGKGLLANINSPGSYNFEYDMDSFSANIVGVYDLINDNDFRISVFGGPSWMRFSQRYKVNTSGTITGIGTTTSMTNEKLIDDLWGTRLGIKGEKKITDKFSISVSGMGDLFYRRSEFKGTQDFSNAITADSVFILSTESTSLGKKLKDNGFTPHLTSEIDVSYQLFPNVTVSAFYQFDFWWNLTRINNPTVGINFSSFPFLLPGSGPVTIEEEDVSSQTFGGKVIMLF